MIEAYSFYLLAIPVVLMVGLSKGGFGGGLGVLAVPLLSLAVDPRLAAAVMLPILCLMDVVSLWLYRHVWGVHNLKYMLPGALAGIAAGAFTFQFMNADTIRALVGVLALYFVGHQLWGKYVLQRVTKQPASFRRGSVWGTIAGYVSYIAHAGGPPIAVYLLPQRLDKTVFVGTTVIFFAIINYIKLVPYAWFGQIRLDTLYSSLILMPLAPLGVLLGRYLHRRVNEALFYKVCYGLLLLAGVRLLWSGVAGMLATA